MKTYIVKIKFDNGMGYDDHYQDNVNAGVFSSNEIALDFIDLLLSQLEAIKAEARLNEGFVNREWVTKNTAFPAIIANWTYDLPNTKGAAIAYNENGTIDFVIEGFDLDRKE